MIWIIITSGYGLLPKGDHAIPNTNASMFSLDPSKRTAIYSDPSVNFLSKNSNIKWTQP